MADGAVGPRLYCCFKCRNPVSCHHDIVSKTFRANNGRAILFSHAMNITLGPKEDSRLITGYWKAYEESQRYKEGKIVLENRKIVEENW
ncbi:Yippee family protein [Salix suchowensis]|nr:Yippee family protein [Salix suchowensis]